MLKNSGPPPHTHTLQVTIILYTIHLASEMGAEAIERAEAKLRRPQMKREMGE